MEIGNVVEVFSSRIRKKSYKFQAFPASSLYQPAAPTREKSFPEIFFFFSAWKNNVEHFLCDLSKSQFF